VPVAAEPVAALAACWRSRAVPVAAVRSRPSVPERGRDVRGDVDAAAAGAASWVVSPPAAAEPSCEHRVDKDTGGGVAVVAGAIV